MEVSESRSIHIFQCVIVYSLFFSFCTRYQLFLNNTHTHTHILCVCLYQFLFLYFFLSFHPDQRTHYSIILRHPIFGRGSCSLCRGYSQLFLSPADRTGVNESTLICLITNIKFHVSCMYRLQNFFYKLN